MSHYLSNSSTSSLRSSSISTNGSITPTQPIAPQVTRSLSSEEAATIPVPRPKRHLKKPKTFYPLKYSRASRDIEVWKYLYYEAATGCPLLTPLDLVPPNPVMLDVACGYGTWCILAARFFKESRITGFDLADIQPDLSRVGHQDLADRITWVHGDMWEVERVLKPGGIFESGQQDAIFPCPKFPPHAVEPRDAAAMDADGDDGKVGISKELADLDPRDHSLLREAFDAMLEVRFINPQPTSTLAFYLETSFDNIFMTPLYHMVLPPSSFVRTKEETIKKILIEPSGMEEVGFDLPSALRMNRKEMNQDSTPLTGGQMDLNQVMATILSAKDAIWEQFEVLNPTLKRSDFNYLFKNWEFDMRDRIDIKTVINEGLNWSIPFCDFDPEYKHWREEVLRFQGMDNIWDAQPLPEPFQNVRVFRAIKNRAPR
ncbi:hypothetical protein BU17DRAFT_82821 [Hysterangium stoloniferum]|nr:hypothetical protein BU17DRAFT_82821 [Hysterangium stoloniferum]